MNDLVLHPRALDRPALALIAARRARALDELTQLSAGDRGWTMCLPAQDEDSDVILLHALHDSQRLEQEVYRLRAGIHRLLYQADWAPEAAAGLRQALAAIIAELPPDPQLAALFDENGLRVTDSLGAGPAPASVNN